VGNVGDSHNPDLQNDQGQLHATLTSYVVERCGGKPLVSPEDPDNSALLLVIAGGQCEDIPQMPFGCGEFCQVPAEVPALRAWIDAGAMQ
jgi:hypothetical protein